MVARLWNHRLVRLSILTLALTAICWPAGPTAAAEPDKLDTSLKLVPADAAFYSCRLRNRELFDIIRNSNAWAKIREMPVVQMGTAAYQAQMSTPGSKLAMASTYMEHPEVRKIVDLLTEMVSDEVFCYGDDSCDEFLQLVQNVNNAVNYGPVVLQATGKAEGRDHGQLQARLAVSALAQHADLIDAPNAIIGFKLKNADLAKEELIKLETMCNLLLESNEQTKGHFKKTKVGKYEYLVLELDGDMVPWDQVPMDKLAEMEFEKGDFQKIIDKLKDTKIVLALGLRDNYLICSIGSSLECLEKLGQGKRLIDQPELKPLGKFADKRLTSIEYLSEDLCKQLNNQGQNVDELVKLVDKLLPLAKLSDSQGQRIRKDVAELAKDLKGLIPEVGAVVNLRFLTDRGVEGYRYAWGNHRRIDGSKPLGLLQHLGGKPILGIVAREKASMGDYDMLVKWIKTGYGYFEEFGLPKIPENDREKAKKFLAAALPLVARLDKANREMLIPALADGQSAVVIDGKLQSKHFVAALPETEKPMPMIEPAIVMGISDANLLKQGLGEYRLAINGLIDAARQVEGSEVPANIQIPEPQANDGPLGTLYSFPLPKELGVDEKIAPTLGISNDTMVFSASREHTERLLKSTPLVPIGVFENPARPRAVAVWIDWVALVNTATPWVDFGLQQAATAKGVGENEQKMIAQQVHTGLDVLKVVRSISAESYLEDGVLVTHTLTEMRDVEK
jgi:hypothetical protein